MTISPLDELRSVVRERQLVNKFFSCLTEKDNVARGNKPLPIIKTVEVPPDIEASCFVKAAMENGSKPEDFKLMAEICMEPAEFNRLYPVERTPLGEAVKKMTQALIEKRN